MDKLKTITGINEKGKKVFSAYKTRKDYVQLIKLWLSLGYSDISEYTD